MTALCYDVAKPDDDAQLREVLAATPMEGQVCVSFRRDPNFFDASVVEGPFRQTVVARDGDLIAGIGCRSIRPRYVNGAPTPIGYLSGLRLRPQYRGSGLLGRGYRYLHTLHQDGRAQLYLTTIAEGNEVAERVLTSARTWLPRYHDAGRYCTLVIPIDRTGRVRGDTAPQLEFRSATAADVPTIVDFLTTNGPRRQFFPCYDRRDFLDEQATFLGLQPSDMMLAFSQHRLVGMVAAWDQRRYRQTVVEGYRGLLRPLRSAYNLWAHLRRMPQLPAPQSVFPFITAALPIVQDDHHEVFRALLTRLARRLTTDATDIVGDYLLLGLHEDDPLTGVARTFATHVYSTRLFYVCWDDGEALRHRIDRRPPYLELGCL